jgi:hypothetical protein
LVWNGLPRLPNGNRPVGRFAANFFDPDESTLSDLRDGARQPDRPETANALVIEGSLSWITILAILLVILIALLDWYVLRPKRASG